MEINALNSKWVDVSSFKNYSGYNALRISSICIPELYIATDNDGYRCLLLFLPTDFDLKLTGADKEKLQLTYIKEKDVILIKLKDVNFVDLFNDLIISLYSRIHEISNPDSYSKELIASFYKWVEFFEDKLIKSLSMDDIQGIFGELFVLNNYVKESDFSNINFSLSSWKGLYGKANDFEFDLKNIEVKTKIESKLFVNISSEFQLEKEFDKGLELFVVTVKIDLIDGKSIHDLILQIVKQVRDNFGDLSILYQALNQKGLTVENLKQYNNYRFIVLKTELFDAASDDFPKLSKSNIAKEISNLKYKLRITQLSQFLIEMKKY